MEIAADPSSTSSMRVLMAAEAQGKTLCTQSIGTASFNYSLKQNSILLHFHVRGRNTVFLLEGSGYAALKAM
jgi:hypothetical protein